MSKPVDTWLLAFDTTLRHYFGVDRVTVVQDMEVLANYRDLPGDEAAMEFALDQSMERIDWWSWGRR